MGDVTPREDDYRLPNSSDSKPSARDNNIWLYLAEAYGPRLVEDFGRAPPAAWREAFAEFSDAQVKRGIKRMLHSGKDFVSLSKFIWSCRQQTPPESKGTPVPQRALPPSQSAQAASAAKSKAVAEMIKGALRHGDWRGAHEAARRRW